MKIKIEITLLSTMLTGTKIFAEWFGSKKDRKDPGKMWAWQVPLIGSKEIFDEKQFVFQFARAWRALGEQILKHIAIQEIKSGHEKDTFLMSIGMEGGETNEERIEEDRTKIEEVVP